MNYKLYVVRDIKSGFQPQIYAFQNDSIAKRFAYQLYHDVVDREPNNPLASFPADFTLYSIGLFSTDGTLEADPLQEVICSFSDFKEV